MEDLAAASLEEEFAGGDLVICGGYKELVNKLAANVMPFIKFGAFVTKIQTEKAKCVSVYCKKTPSQWMKVLVNIPFTFSGNFFTRSTFIF